MPNPEILCITILIGINTKNIEKADCCNKSICKVVCFKIGGNLGVCYVYGFGLEKTKGKKWNTEKYARPFCLLNFFIETLFNDELESFSGLVYIQVQI